MTRDLKVPGGVTNFFRIFFKNYSHDDIAIEHFKQGISKEQSTKQIIPYVLSYPIDIVRFIRKIITDRSLIIVHLNPSFFTVPIVRDSIYILISKAMRKKVLVFFHGWDKGYYKKLKESTIRRKIFHCIYSKADSLYVLAEDFKDSLISLGFMKTEVSKTFFDGDIFSGYIRKKSKTPNLLYVGRMQEEKGILVILEALHGLHVKGYDFKMDFIGWFVDDEIRIKVEEKIKLYGIEEKVNYLGYYPDQKKVEKFNDSDVFLYPSYYPEGCPTVVMEAMAGGCLIISTDVAALKEVIRNGENGFIVKQKDPDDLMKKIEYIIKNYDLFYEMSKSIKEEAFKRYESRIIIAQIHGTYVKLLKGDLHK